MRYEPTIGMSFLLLAVLIVLCGCKSIERTIRNQRKLEIKEIVADEVPRIVSTTVGDMAIRYAPYGVIAALGGAGIIRKAGRKKTP